MALFKDYLALKAKFYSPPTTGTMVSTTKTNEVEVSALETAWTPSSGRRDPNLVDSLIKTLDDYLGDRPVPSPQTMLDIRFQPFIDDNGIAWEINEFESQARFMVESGAILGVIHVMKYLGHVIRRHPDQSPEGFGSKVDFNLVGSNHRKVLVEVKAPSVLERVLPTFEREAVRIELGNSIPEEAILDKACLYMASHQARWLALTSHNKWVFLRLHDNVDDGPYITYSTIEQQADNTRPFRALLGMMLAAECDLNVESHANLTVELPPIIEEHEPEDNPGDSDRPDTSGLYRGTAGPTREERPVTRSQTAGRSANRSLLVSWAESELRVTKWMSYCPVDGTEQCSSLGDEPVRLRLQRFLGRGSTGTVFEAKSDLDGCGDARSYAFKTVVKGSHEEEEGQIQRLLAEFKIYCNIEQARQSGKICNAAPRCYGLYESPNLLVLISDYEGEPLSDAEWSSLEYQEKSEIFNAIRELHEIGVCHHDLEPRNIVRNANGRFKIIDFSIGTMHRCLGIKQIGSSSSDRYGDDECGELKVMWWELMRQQPLKIVGEPKKT